MHKQESIRLVKVQTKEGTEYFIGEEENQTPIPEEFEDNEKEESESEKVTNRKSNAQSDRAQYADLLYGTDSDMSDSLEESYEDDDDEMERIDTSIIEKPRISADCFDDEKQA